jgi:predicted MFS family arabinose efflux permease
MTTLADPARASSGDSRRRRLPWTLPANYLILHMGFFTLAPILPILVKTRLAGGAAEVGVVLFAYNSAIGYSCLLITRWISRVPPRAGMVAGLSVSAASMVALAYSDSLAAIICVLVLAGSGLSTHFLLARTLLAEVIPGHSGRNHAYSMIALAVNVAGAVAPIAATTVYAISGAKTLLFIVAGFYLAAALLLLVMVPADLQPLASSLRWPISRATFRAIRHDTASIRIIMMSAAGGFIYSQFFSSIALLITTFIAKGPEQGLLFAINAVTVIIVQVPMTMAIGRRLDRGMPPSSAMRLGLIIFSASMLSLGLLLHTGLALFITFGIMILIFSVAETIYTPVRDTAYAAMPAASQLEAFNLRFIFITIGESVGALCGGAIFLTLAGHGTGAAYWLVLGAGGLLVTIVASLLHVSRPAAADSQNLTVTVPDEA